MPLYTISTQSGVLAGEAKAALAEELTAFHCAYSGCTANLGTRHLSGVRARQWLHSRKGCARRSTHVTDPNGSVGGVQTGAHQAPMGTLPGRHTHPGRSDRHRSSGSTAQPGYGDGPDHARGGRLLNCPQPRHRSTSNASLSVSDWTGRPAPRL